MIVIGITGSVASGKSHIARVMRQSFSIPVFDADREVSRLLTLPFVRGKIKQYDHSVKSYEKTFLREWVKKDPKNLDALEDLLHPLVLDAVFSFIKKSQAYGCSMVALEVPLLFEVGWNDLCNFVILADVSESLQKKRLYQRGYSYRDIEWRRERMLPMSLKREFADFVIPSQGGFRYAFEKIQQIIKILHAPNRSRHRNNWS